MTLISDKFYDRSKTMARLVLPTFGVLYFLLSGVFDLPATKEVLGAVLLALFGLGWMLHLSSKIYGHSEARFDGQMDVQKLADKTVVQMAFTDEKQLETLTEKQEVLFKVNHLDE